MFILDKGLTARFRAEFSSAMSPIRREFEAYMTNSSREKLRQELEAVIKSNSLGAEAVAVCQELLAALSN